MIRSERTQAMMPIAKSKTVVFVHGMFMTPLAWEKWEAHFAAKGYKTLAPAWPLHDLPIEDQRKNHPNPKLGELTLDTVLSHYRQVLKGLDEKPILVGHSMGGLIVQILLAEGLGAAGIAIDSAPPKGVISLKYSFLKSNWPVISPSAKVSEPFFPTQQNFDYSFSNCIPAAEQKSAYERFAVPESRRVGKAPTEDVAKINFQTARPPLLLIAGSLDHIIPASLNRSNYDKYDRSPSITDFREFEGRCHFIIGQTGWEEVADYVLDWIAKNQ
ncbi:MAG TPA: alpha/beta hydrolase [Pseudomonadota bacterium]|nr:alpha/beta hydrolase [Pseudomonadota bacterium]HNO69252.1 alpha/beta hydrolase [Pseudomonadota bacterium]